MQPIKILQLSDTHFLKDPSAELWGANPYNNFCKTIETAKKYLLKPDLILLTGDLSQDDTPESYQLLAKLVENFSCDVFFIPGNHDVPSVMEKFFRGKNIRNDRLIFLDEWAIILLDSTKEGKTSGVLSDKELQFLREGLEQTRHLQVIIVLHHHPISMQSALMDQYILENRAEFMSVISNYMHVKTVLFGHVHQVFETSVNQIAFLSCPSTFVQFPTAAPNLVIDLLPPGYRWLELENKSFTTGIGRAPFDS